MKQNAKEVKNNIERSRKREKGPLGPTSASRWWGHNPLFFLIFLFFLDFLNILFDFIDNSKNDHDLPNVLEARTIRARAPKNDVSLRGFCHMAPSKKKEHKILVRTVPELAHQTFWRPHSCRFKDKDDMAGQG